MFICDGCIALTSDIAAGASTGGSQIAPWEPPLDDVLANLAPVAAAVAQAEQNLGCWVVKARSLGTTWAQIGQALGMTRQSVWERFSGERQRDRNGVDNCVNRR